MKSDGKSSTDSENVSEKFTQRATNDDFYYEESDITGTQDYAERIKKSTFFGFGFFFVLLAFFLLQGESMTREHLNSERDRILQEYGDYEHSMQEKQKRKEKSPFDEA